MCCYLRRVIIQDVILEGFCVAVNGEKFWAKNQRHYKRYVVIPDVVISKVYCIWRAEMQNVIYTKSPIFRFLHHLKARDRLSLCVESVVSRCDIFRSNRGLKSPMLCRTRYMPAAGFFKARYTRFTLVVSYASRTRPSSWTQILILKLTGRVMEFTIKASPPLVRIIIRRLCQEWSPLPVMKHLSQNHVKVD